MQVHHATTVDGDEKIQVRHVCSNLIDGMNVLIGIYH